ncbi:DUF3805 domain-containing protein [Dyadobacter diqingensis]|uniref:DUF3805 domain-containing protein n=1 Tax=Dyadobacter diqingensis TaxID=2938121 RepID=UPI0020C1A8CF|nr:DUF3805 domain-containing protein [Dyadobacter diqingensis]
MSSKHFISRNGWFSLSLPDGWEEYNDGDDSDNYAFFNAAAKSWTGNFRITSFRWTDLIDSSEDKASQYIEEELAKEGVQNIRLGSFNCAHYKEESIQDDDEQVVYYWITGKTSDLYICSFVIDKKQENTSINLQELDSVQNMIGSIQPNYATK